MNPAVSSVTAFFPCYNDAPVIGSLVEAVHEVLRESVDAFEVVVVDDGSEDDSLAVLREVAGRLANVRVVVHERNRGYGGALRSGFEAATKELIAYTDGDAQYDPAEIEVLWNRLTDDADLVNGYKISRSDPLHRIIIGRIYHHIVKFLFRLRVRDVDCDFRLMRRQVFEKVVLTRSSGVICVELMKKVRDHGYRIAQVPVHHYHRSYGKSQFFNFRRVGRTLADLARLWVELVVRREHLKASAADATEPHEPTEAR